MTPQLFKYILDFAVVLLGAYMFILARKSIGGVVGSAFQFVILGIGILAVNHILDTAILADYMKRMGHTQDYLQSSIIHRAINLVGFFCMAFGFTRLKTIQR